jgi:hypothetical protein
LLNGRRCGRWLSNGANGGWRPYRTKSVVRRTSNVLSTSRCVREG